METELLMILDPLFFLSLFSVMFYSFLLFIILSSESSVFHSAFFRIFVFTGVFDVIAVIAQEWIRADYKIGFGPHYEIVTRIMNAFTATNLFTHIFGTLLMTLNRYTAACHPQWHQVFWNKTVVWLLLALDVTVSYGANFPLFLTKFYYEKTADGWEYLGRKDSVLGIRLMITIVLFSHEFISVILITLTVVTIKREMKKTGLAKGREMGLILFTVISVSMSLLEALYEISYFVDPGLKTMFFKWIVEQFDNYCFVILTMNAYSIVLLSRVLRNEVKRRLLCWIRCSKMHRLTFSVCESHHTNEFLSRTSAKPTMFRLKSVA